MNVKRYNFITNLYRQEIKKSQFCKIITTVGNLHCSLKALYCWSAKDIPDHEDKTEADHGAKNDGVTFFSQIDLVH